jgi:predicted dienelactone hydrolase
MQQPTMRSRWTAMVGAALLAAALMLAGCGSSGSKGSGAAAVPSGPAPYAKTGPYAVGYTNLRLADGRRVVVWYPAAEGKTAGHAQESIDVASFLTPQLQAKVPATDRVKYLAKAYDRAPAATDHGPYPLVLFSHGYAGFPEQSVSLTTHLASWGFVVAAPDHVERSLDGMLGSAAAGVPARKDPAVLQATLDRVVQASGQAGLLHGLVDAQHVAVTGHSAGAGAAYDLASADPRIKAWISYSVGLGPEDGHPAVPDKPGMVMLGTADGVIPPTSSEQVYAGMHPPKYLVKVAGAGHLVFSDICLIGTDKGGIVGIAKKLNLGIPESLLKLGSDGCGAKYPDPAKAFPAIDQLSVAFLRNVFGSDATPRGMTTAAVADLGADVTVTHQG